MDFPIGFLQYPSGVVIYYFMEEDIIQRLENEFMAILNVKNRNDNLIHFQVGTKRKGCLSWLIMNEPEDDKLRMLKFLIQEFGTIILSYSENPISEKGIGTWSLINGRVYLLSDKANIDFDKFFSFLKLGGWNLFFYGDNVDVSEFTLFKKGEDLMPKSKADCMLDSFYDNNEWELYLKRK